MVEKENGSNVILHGVDHSAVHHNVLIYVVKRDDRAALFLRDRAGQGKKSAGRGGATIPDANILRTKMSLTCLSNTA